MATGSKPTIGLGPSSAYITNEVNPAQVGRFTPSGNIPNSKHDGYSVDCGSGMADLKLQTVQRIVSN